jgi:Telomere resolvase
MPERCPGDYPHLSAFSANALDDLGIPRCPVSTATRSAPWSPITWSCAGQRFSYLALDPEETRALNAAYHQRIHHDQSNLIPLGSRKPSSKRLSNSSPATATSKKAWGLMALTGRRPAEIFFSASFSLPREKLPYPALLFDGQLKTRQAPGTSFEPYLIPRSGRSQENRSGPRHSPGPQKLSFPRSR